MNIQEKQRLFERLFSNFLKISSVSGLSLYYTEAERPEVDVERDILKTFREYRGKKRELIEEDFIISTALSDLYLKDETVRVLEDSMDKEDFDQNFLLALSYLDQGKYGEAISQLERCYRYSTSPGTSSAVDRLTIQTKVASSIVLSPETDGPTWTI